MRSIRHIVPLLLVFALTMAGVPFISVQYDQRDGSSGLRSAVIGVGHLVQQAEEPGALQPDAALTVTALRAAAGLETVIAGDDASDAFLLTVRAGPYLPASIPACPEYLSFERPVSLNDNLYSSVVTDRVERPPRA